MQKKPKKPTLILPKNSLKMLEFLIDNIFVMFHGRGLQQTVGIPMGTHCVPPLVDLFLYSYKAYFIQGLLKISEQKLARSFIFTFRYIDDVLPLNLDLVILMITSSPLSLKLRIPQIQPCLLHTFTYTSKLTLRAC